MLDWTLLLHFSCNPQQYNEYHQNNLHINHNNTAIIVRIILIIFKIEIYPLNKRPTMAPLSYTKQPDTTAAAHTTMTRAKHDANRFVLLLIDPTVGHSIQKNNYFALCSHLSGSFYHQRCTFHSKGRCIWLNMKGLKKLQIGARQKSTKRLCTSVVCKLDESSATDRE